MSNSKLNLALMSAALLATVSGCTNTSSETQGQRVDALSVDGIIAEKTSEAVAAQEKFASHMVNGDIIKTRRQAALETDIIDVDFIGSPEELLQTIAHRYSYRYVESGKKRTVPNVNVFKSQSKPVDVLRSVGVSTDKFADVILDQESKTIRFHYK